MNAVQICMWYGDSTMYIREGCVAVIACQPEDDVMCLVTLSIFVGIAYVVSLQVRTLCQGFYEFHPCPISSLSQVQGRYNYLD